MTKITKETEMRQVVTKETIICDLCGTDAEVQPERPKPAFLCQEGEEVQPPIFERWPGSPSFDDRSVGETFFDWVPVEIEYEQGERFPEGSKIERLTIHLCPKCFRNRFLRWFSEQGGKLPPVDTSDY